MRENFNVASEENKKIKEIMSFLDKKIDEWFKNEKKDSEGLFYNKNTYSNSKTNVLKISLESYNLDIVFRDDVKKMYGYYDGSTKPPSIVLSTKFKEGELSYHKMTLHHELQHYFDYQSKYKGKEAEIDKKYISPDEGFTDHISQPVEFNAYFTSLFFSTIDKHKNKSFSEYIKAIYKENKQFRDFFDSYTRAYRKRFLKRLFTYHKEYLKNNS